MQGARTGQLIRRHSDTPAKFRSKPNAGASVFAHPQVIVDAPVPAGARYVSALKAADCTMPIVFGNVGMSFLCAALKGEPSLRFGVRIRQRC